jgi:hypothetical protein
MDSPRFYNFETDRIYAKNTKKQVRALRKHVADNNLQKVIEDRFTSRSGFISYYDNDLKAWSKDAGAWDHNQVETLLLAVMYQAGENDPYACHHWQVDSGNGEIDDCIYGTLPESKKHVLNALRDLLESNEIAEFYETLERHKYNEAIRPHLKGEVMRLPNQERI